MKRKTLFISIGLHALCLTVVFIFQGMIFSHIRVDGFTPLLLPLVSTAVAVYEGRVAGGVAGLFAGILCDLSFGDPVAVFTIILTFTGLAIGTLVDTVVTRGFVTYFMFCVGVLALCAVIQGLQLVIVIYSLQLQLINLGIPPVEIPPIHDLMQNALWQIIYSLIFAVPIWIFVSAIGKRVYRESMSGKPQ